MRDEGIFLRYQTLAALSSVNFEMDFFFFKKTLRFARQYFSFLTVNNSIKEFEEFLSCTHHSISAVVHPFDKIHFLTR